MNQTRVKMEARQLVDSLVDDATWGDLMHKIYVRQAIEFGIEDSEAGRITSGEDVRTEYGLPS